jgi:hypothetical protein
MNIVHLRWCSHQLRIHDADCSYARGNSIDSNRGSVAYAEHSLSSFRWKQAQTSSDSFEMAMAKVVSTEELMKATLLLMYKATIS